MNELPQIPEVVGPEYKSLSLRPLSPCCSGTPDAPELDSHPFQTACDLLVGCMQIVSLTLYGSELAWTRGKHHGIDMYQADSGVSSLPP